MNASDSIQKEQLLGFLEAVPFMAWYKNREGVFLYVNQLYADGCGKHKAEIVGKTDFDVWSRGLAEAYRMDDEIVMQTQKVKLIEELIDNQKGGKWFETFKAPAFDESGNVVGTIGTAKDITLRKHYQIELQNQKNLIRSMIDAVPDLIFFKDINGVYLGCNEAFAHQFIGVTEAEIIGKTDLDLISETELAELFIERDRKVLEVNATIINAEVVRYANGDIVQLETVKTPFYDENGNVKGIIGIARDISERIIIKDQLKERELWLSLATGSGNIGLWDWRVQTGETVFNEQWANIIGYTLAELEPVSIATWIKLTHSEDIHRSNQMLQAHFEGKRELYECEVRMLHKEGHWVWVLDRGKVTEWDADQRPVRMLGTHIDISDQKRTEFSLRKKEQILSAVASSIKELIVNRDYLSAIEKCFHLVGTATMVDRAYLFVNTYVVGEAYTSHSIEWNSGDAEAQINNPDLQMIPFAEVGSFIEPLMVGEAFQGIVRDMPMDYTRELLESQGIRSIIVLPIFVRNVFWGFIGFDECKSDRIWEESEFSTLMAFAHSVEKSVERSLIENELLREKKNAEAANLLKSQFVANISHEIRTPIHAILGYASLIKEHATDKQCFAYLESIQKAGDALMGLLNDILDLSKIEAGKLELQLTFCDIGNLLADVEHLFTLRASEKNLIFIIRMDPDIPQQIYIDEVRLRQILFNLVGNALKFTPKGFVDVRVQLVQIDSIGHRVDLKIMVQDSGIGIPQDQLEDIFAPFKQKDGQSTKKYGGTGLGLSITERLVEMMGGRIEVHSQVDVGTTFMVHLNALPYKEDKEKRTNGVITFSGIDNSKEERGASRDSSKGQDGQISEQLRDILKKTLMESWQRCIKTNRVGDIRQFAEDLKALGDRFDHSETKRFSETLSKAIEAYDLRRVREVLQYFPEWVRRDDIKSDDKE